MERLASGDPVDELEGLELLGAYGVPVVASRSAGSLDETVAAAGALGWPVALKTAMPGIAHKTELGGVMLGLDGRFALAEAYGRLAQRLGPKVTVARMAPAGVELALGVVRDPQFGPLVLVAAGGILVELLHDRRLALPPLDASRARSMIDRLKVRPLLDGVRGAPAADVASLAQAIVGLSWLAHDLGDLLEALDVNPVIVTPAAAWRSTPSSFPARTPARTRARRRRGRERCRAASPHSPRGIGRASRSIARPSGRAWRPSAGRGRSRRRARSCASLRIRSVRCGRPQLSSMNLSGDENSPTASSMYPRFAYGESVSIGTRKPRPTSSTAGGGTGS